jgi:hypothetical protein
VAVFPDWPPAENGIVVGAGIGRRQFVEIAANFPQECGYVFEALGMVYGNDTLAREQGLDADARLRLHQQYSGQPVEQLHGWLRSNLTSLRQNRTQGWARRSRISQSLATLTLFPREKGAPLDNNLCERASKKAILNRKNSIYKASNGAMVGDLFMSLIHTCELSGVNSFHYLTELRRHSSDVKRTPADWMPWNYDQPLGRKQSLTAA